MQARVRARIHVCPGKNIWGAPPINPGFIPKISVPFGYVIFVYNACILLGLCCELPQIPIPCSPSLGLALPCIFPQGANLRGKPRHISRANPTRRARALAGLNDIRSLLPCDICPTRYVSLLIFSPRDIYPAGYLCHGKRIQRGIYPTKNVCRGVFIPCQKMENLISDFAIFPVG